MRSRYAHFSVRCVNDVFRTTFDTLYLKIKLPLKVSLFLNFPLEELKTGSHRSMFNFYFTDFLGLSVKQILFKIKRKHLEFNENQVEHFK